MERDSIIKWILIAIGAIILIVIIISLFNNRGNNQGNIDNQIYGGDVNYTETEGGTRINTSKDISEDKKVGDVLLEESKIVYENGMSKLTSKVTNNGGIKDNLRFKVKFLDSTGNVIAESVGFVGQIKEKEVKYIDSYITLDVANAKDVVYELME